MIVGEPCSLLWFLFGFHERIYQVRAIFCIFNYWHQNVSSIVVEKKTVYSDTHFGASQIKQQEVVTEQMISTRKGNILWRNTCTYQHWNFLFFMVKSNCGDPGRNFKLGCINITISISSVSSVMFMAKMLQTQRHPLNTFSIWRTVQPNKAIFLKRSEQNIKDILLYLKINF
jgi:hypothetical protein